MTAVSALISNSDNYPERLTLILREQNSMRPKPNMTQFLFLRTLVPVALTAGFPAGTFLLAPAPPIPLIVPMTVFFNGSFFAAAPGFFTTVELLVSLESLIVLALPLPTLGAGAAAAVLLPRPTPVVLAGSGAFRVAAPRDDFAFSTMFVRIPAAPPGGTGAVGLRGDTGRAKFDLDGDGRIGERGIVRELADRGDKTCVCSLARDVVRVGGTGAPRVRFFGFSTSSFSLSPEEISSLKSSVKERNTS